jgi:transposase
VALEGTGGYWKPIFNRLEGEFEGRLVNARPIPFVPGGKTDVKAGEGIGQ